MRTTELVKKNPELIKKWMADCPVGRLCKVWELKGVYVFLASGASSYVTGADYVVDGNLAPTRWVVVVVKTHAYWGCLY